MNYLATFYTHFGAQESSRKMKNSGITQQMKPVPRCLSASCGTCVEFEMDHCDFSLFMNEETERVYELKENGEYNVMYENF